MKPKKSPKKKKCTPEETPAYLLVYQNSSATRW